VCAITTPSLSPSPALGPPPLSPCADTFLNINTTLLSLPLLCSPRPLPPLVPLPGAHTRAITVATPSSASGGIMRFAKVKATCLACRAPLKEEACGAALCSHCAHKEGEIYNRTLNNVNALERDFGETPMRQRGWARGGWSRWSTGMGGWGLASSAPFPSHQHTLMGCALWSQCQRCQSVAKQSHSNTLTVPGPPPPSPLVPLTHQRLDT
jgi:hypothetical protein